MERMVKEVMDGLFGGGVTFQEALERLSVSEEKLHRMIDEYEYTPTTKEILEANRMMTKNLEFIEREISINCRRGIPQNIKLTDATGIMGKASAANASMVTDAANSMKPRVLPVTLTTDVLSYPHERPYHW